MSTILDDRPHDRFPRNRLLALGMLSEVRLWGLRFDLDAFPIPPRVRAAVVNGNFEREEAEAVEAVIDRDHPVVEFGGGMGVITCHTNRYLRHRDRHVVVEMDPRLCKALARNRELNGASFDVVNGALSYAEKPLTVRLSTGYFMVHRPDREGKGPVVEVPPMSLQSVLRAKRWTDVNLHLDVEGCELELFDREADLVRSSVRTIVLETHPHMYGSDAAARLLEHIRGLGFQQVFQRRDVHGFVRRDVLAAREAAKAVAPDTHALVKGRK